MPTKRAKPPTVRLRRLAAELRRLRSAAQLSRENVEEQTGINEGTLYRLETARARPQRRTLMTLLDLYGADDPLRSDLLAIAQGADNQGWLRPYHSALPEEYTAYISFEAEARSVRNYESLFIPGLLQTEDYARAVIPASSPASPRTSRPARPGPHRAPAASGPRRPARTVGRHRRSSHPPPGRRQEDHERADQAHPGSSAKPNVTIQVIPFEAGAPSRHARLVRAHGLQGPA